MAKRFAPRRGCGNRPDHGQPVRNHADLAWCGGCRGRDPASGGELLAGGYRSWADRDTVAAHTWPGAARRVDRETSAHVEVGAAAGKTVIFGFGRVGRMVADMLASHGKAYLAVEHDIDAVLASREAGYGVLFGDVARGAMIDKLGLNDAEALVLTMDDPVLIIRLTRQIRRLFPDLAIIARARDTDHAARLYRAGVTDAVPEAMEASLQLSEAVLVDIGVAMGPVIASIHEKRSELRSEIMEAGEMAEAPRLGRRRVRDVTQ